MWIAHLTVMFSALSSICLGFVMICVENIAIVASVGTGYVDDVTLGMSLPGSGTKENLGWSVKVAERKTFFYMNQKRKD